MISGAVIRKGGRLSLPVEVIDALMRLTSEERQLALIQLRKQAELAKASPEVCATRSALMRRRYQRVKAATTERVDRAAIIARDGGVCYLCGVKPQGSDLALDHVVPIVRGGSHCADNLRVACKSCNSRKGSKLLSKTEVG